MHERKQTIYDLSDAFTALPGGLGTLDEIFEILTWGQLGLHQKPCGFLNVGGYYDALLQFVDHAVSNRFIRTDCATMILRDTEPENLLAQFERFKHVPLPHVITNEAR